MIAAAREAAAREAVPLLEAAGLRARWVAGDVVEVADGRGVRVHVRVRRAVGVVEAVWRVLDWSAHGRAAGARRNGEMLAEGGVVAVVAFPGGSGTADMVRRARRAGLPVWEVARG